ncbi:malate dehydrogenase [Leucobacter triazinivorans]|uniref:Malate dehydrogenase n=1 Tax=Leucobacter triazinivorans TaxID=1784719 RepID=A0A4P6KBX5_9MICO|nr:malate dehydrogenase [Leucobacter triazinivorans]QBE47806.1 malate dehydrogenase [Leucobacter triazinivorans]
MPKPPVTITLTGAGGQIGYAAMFRIAAGDMLGADQPVALRLLEIPQGMRGAEGAAMELADCAFPLLAGVEITDDPNVGFDGASVAMLIGSRPRTAGMERGDLLAANGAIFGPQGRAIGAHAADDVRVIVVGNPANTNALIAQQHAPDLPPERFTALTRLDHNRAVGLLAAEAGVAVADVGGVTIWGNHSATQYPDLSHATVSGRPALDAVDPAWARGAYVDRVAKRGAEIIEVRGGSSVASAANAAIEHVRDWALGTPDGAWTSAAVVSRGEYGVPAGLVSSFPVVSRGGDWEIVEGLSVDEFSRRRIDASVAELVAERDAVRELGLIE